MDHNLKLTLSYCKLVRNHKMNLNNLLGLIGDKCELRFLKKIEKNISANIFEKIFHNLNIFKKYQIKKSEMTNASVRNTPVDGFLNFKPIALGNECESVASGKSPSSSTGSSNFVPSSIFS